MTTSVILLCGGSASRWDNHMGITKHMVPIKGEPLIVRTRRQIKARLGVEAKVVAADPRIIELVGRQHCITEYDKSCCSGGALSTAAFWAERTIILFGDTYYDAKTMTAFLAATGLRAYWAKSQFLGYHWDAVPDRRRVEAAMRAAVCVRPLAKHPTSQQGMGYLNYSFHLLQGLPIVEEPVKLSKNRHRKDSPLVLEAPGVCMDFDYPIEYATFLKLWKPDDLV